MMYQYPDGTTIQWTYPYYDQSNGYNFQYQWWGNCPHCGVAISWWSQYCPHCGKQLAVQPDKEETLKEVKKLLEEIQEKINKISKEEST